MDLLAATGTRRGIATVGDQHGVANLVIATEHGCSDLLTVSNVVLSLPVVGFLASRFIPRLAASVHAILAEPRATISTLAMSVEGRVRLLFTASGAALHDLQRHAPIITYHGRG